MTGLQIAGSWIAIVAQSYIPWPLNILIGVVLMMALLPAIVDLALRIRALRKQRRAA